MSIWLQKSASIQKRTSPLKFAHFRCPKPDFTASDLSNKAPALGQSGPALKEAGAEGAGVPVPAMENGVDAAVLVDQLLDATMLTRREKISKFNR